MVCEIYIHIYDLVKYHSATIVCDVFYFEKLLAMNQPDTPRKIVIYTFIFYTQLLNINCHCLIFY